MSVRLHYYRHYKQSEVIFTYMNFNQLANRLLRRLSSQ